MSTKRRKTCIFVDCESSSTTVPRKLFFACPRTNLEKRRQWFEAAGRKDLPTGHGFFCCEDHFNLAIDCENWMYFKTMGKSLKLRKDVVPHKNLEGTEMASHSQFSDAAKKRKAEIIAHLNKPQKVAGKIYTPYPQVRHLRRSDVIPSQELPQVDNDEPKTSNKIRIVKCNGKKVLLQDTSNLKEIHPSEEQISDIRLQPSISETTKSSCDTKLFEDPLDDDGFGKEKSFEDKSVQTDFNNFTLVDLLDTDSKLEEFTSADHSLLNRIADCCENVSHNQYGDLKLKIMLTLTKIKLNIPFACLAILFNLSLSTCTNYFYNVLGLLSRTLKPAIYWPTREEVMANLPNCFEKYKTTRIIFDSIEIGFQKWLIGVTPCGLISYISSENEEESSDLSSLIEKKLQENCDPEDIIIVDRGFFLKQGCKDIFMLKPAEHFSKKEVDIARARIHVERTIQQIRKFKIITDETRAILLPSMDSIMTIVVALVNLSPTILSDVKTEYQDLKVTN